MNWAKAFCAVAASKGINLGDDPEGWMVGWFANAIVRASIDGFRVVHTRGEKYPAEQHE